MGALDRFHSGIKAKATLSTYDWGLQRFLEHMHLDADSFVEKAKADTSWGEQEVEAYMKVFKERADRGEVSSSLARMRLAPVKLLCVMNKVKLDWEYINKQLPKSKHYGDDRVPTVEEVRAACEHSNLRVRAVILLMASGGFRLGAWEKMKLKHIVPIESNKKVVAARVAVYPGDPEQYFTFVTPEAWQALQAYTAYRERSGEAVSEESWVVRDTFNSRSGHNGAASAPQPLKPEGIQYLIQQAWSKAGVRKSLGKRKREFKVVHSLRKWFKTHAEQAMRPINVELLMGHGVGISSSYYKPTERELLDDYLKAVPMLTVSETVELKQKMESSEKENEQQWKDMKLQMLSTKDELRETKERQTRLEQNMKMLLEHPELARAFKAHSEQK